MKNRILFVAVATMSLFFASCSIYHPQAVDMPLINHRGDLRIDASASTSVFLIIPDAFNFNVTTSYGFNDWLSGQIHANYGGDNWYLQAAPGGYLSLGGKAVTEAYFGLGYGGSNHKDSGSSSDTVSASYYIYKGQYLLPFAQFNIGWRNLGPVDIVFGVKTGAFMPNFEYHRYNSDGTEQVNNATSYSTPNFLLEPQIQFGVGSDKAKLNLRLGYTFMNDLNDASSKMYHDFLTFSAGLMLAF